MRIDTISALFIAIVGLVSVPVASSKCYTINVIVIIFLVRSQCWFGWFSSNLCCCLEWSISVLH